MRKRLRVFVISAFLVLPLGARALAQGNLRISFDMAGDHKVSADTWNTTIDTEAGVSVALELATQDTRDAEVGVGAEYQMLRELSDYPDDEFNFIPVYFYAKMYARSGGSTAFLLGRFGYNLYEGNADYKGSADLEGGLYYSVGVGLIASGTAEIELAYVVNNGVRAYGTSDVDVEYSRVSIGVSVVF
ncbi:MAG: hypothetical protein ACYTFI_04265 [Planctomycetota bacterium]|jgi:hypothetical protein